MSILLTKVRQPQRRKDLLRRVRLVDSIHQNIHRKLTFVSAPAGYGKTTLLIDFASDVDANVCWYLISPEDKDLIQFIRHILAAFQQQFPDFGIELEESLNLTSGTANGISIAIDLINEIETKIDDFTVLVLDDYHLAGENEEIVEFIEKLIEHLPDQLRILIGSRSVYGIPTANLYIRDELVTISAEELRFRPDELQKLVLQNYRLKLSDEQAEDFASRADGWIVAILLALRAMDTQGAIPKLIGGTEKIYEYLAEEVVNRQSPELRNFLYSTSILGEFDEELVNFVREKKDSSVYLQSLEERNLFVTRTEMSNGSSYRYHQLFSEFLQEQFEKHDSRRLVKLHNRAAEWHKDRLEWESAIHHKLKAKEHKIAAEWIDARASQFFATGRQRLLANWQKMLSMTKNNIYTSAPRLMLFQAKAFAEQGNIEEAEKLLTQSIKYLKDSKDPKTLANATTTLGMIRIIQGQYKEALKLGNNSLAILNNKPSKKHFLHQNLQAERLIGRAYFNLKKPDKANEYLKMALRGFRKMLKNSTPVQSQDYKHDLALLLSDIGFLAFSEGKTLNAQKAFQEALDLHISAKSNSGAIARNNIAYVFHQTGRYEQAWKQYAMALKDAKKAGRVREELGILSGQGSLLFDIADYENAEIIFNQVFELSIQYNDDRAKKASQTGLSDISRIKGQHAEAMNLLRDAASHEGTNMFSPFYTMRLGRIYFDMGQTDLALEQFKKTISTGSPESHFTEDQILASFYLFVILSKDEHLGNGQIYLDSALKEVANLGYDQFLINAAKSYLPILKENSKTKAHPQLLDLITRAEKPKGLKSGYAPAKSQISSDPVHLDVFAFGKTDVRANSELIPSTSWKSSRARTLFYYILDNKSVSKEKIGLDFWPEFSTGKISSNFHATLWRVRQALPSKEIIVFSENEYFINPNYSVWYDVSEFETFFDQAKSESNSDSNQIELFRQAAKLYKGSFLRDIYMDWAQIRKSELENKYIETIKTIAIYEMGKGVFAEASKLFKVILGIDPYQDQIHLMHMDCLIQSGEKDEARSHFHNYKNLLQNDLNAKPMTELQKFYEANQL